jgi:hypothetical protein
MEIGLAAATMSASGTPIGFQLSGSFQSELTAPVHNGMLIGVLSLGSVPN